MSDLVFKYVASIAEILVHTGSIYMDYADSHVPVDKTSQV